MVNQVLNSETFRTIQRDLQIMCINLPDKPEAGTHTDLLQVLTEIHSLFAKEVDKRNN